MTRFQVNQTVRRLDPKDREAFYQRNSTNRRTFGFSNWFAGWAYFNTLFGILMGLLVYDENFKTLGWALVPIMIGSCFLQVILGSALFKLPTRMPWTIFAMLVFFFYAILSTVLANRDLGRSVEASFGWHTQCLVWYSGSCLSCLQATYCNEKFRVLVKRTVILVCLVSCFIGICQNFRVPIVSQVFPIKLQAAEGVYRATGLTNYPSQLGFQGMLGMALIGAPLVRRSLTFWEWSAIAMCGLAILCAQYRSMYYSGLGLCVLSLMALSFRRDKTTSALILAVSICLISFILLVSPSNFNYGTRGASNDPALQAREFAWKQTEEAQLYNPLTGIGADYSLAIGSVRGPGADKWSTNSVDNLYLMVRTCYGWVGVALAGVFCVLFAAGVGSRIVLGSQAVQDIGIGLAIASVSVLVFSLTGNSLIYTTVGGNMAILAGILGNTSREEYDTHLQVSQAVRMRAWVNTISRRLGLNLG